jgi:hypothetical protein
VPTTWLSIEHHPIHLHRRPSQPTTPLSSVEGVATPSSWSCRTRCRVGLHLQPLLPPRAGYRRPVCFDLIRSDRPHHKLPHCSLVLPNPRFYSSSHWSEPSLTTNSPLTALPSTCCAGEPLFSQPPPIDSLGDKLPPWLLLLHQWSVGPRR